MTDPAIVRRLLTDLAGFMRDLNEDAQATLDGFLSDRHLSRSVERTLEVSVQCCLDVGMHIITDDDLREPENNSDVFRVLGSAGIIASELVPDLVSMVKFRNLLAHIYGKVDPVKVYGILQDSRTVFAQFMRAMVSYIS